MFYLLFRGPGLVAPLPLTSTTVPPGLTHRVERWRFAHSTIGSTRASVPKTLFARTPAACHLGSRNTRRCRCRCRRSTIGPRRWVIVARPPSRQGRDKRTIRARRTVPDAVSSVYRVIGGVRGQCTGAGPRQTVDENETIKP